MTKFQPGVGYGFKQSGWGVSLDTSDPFPAPTYRANEHPFKIIDLGFNSTLNDYAFKVVPGSVDSLIPQLGITADPTKRLDYVPAPITAWNFHPSNYYSYIYLRVGCDNSGLPEIFPVTDQTDSLYPRVISTIVEQASNNGSGYLLLATAYKDPATNAITVWQLIRSSQWADRIKVAGTDAKYFFAAV